jgi:hypothetical protein
MNSKKSILPSNNYDNQSKWLPRSLIDLRLPTTWIGKGLKGLTKEYYDVLIRKIESFYQQTKFSEYLLVDIITFVNQIYYKIEKADFIVLFKELLNYLRHQLLKKDPIVYYCTIKVVDYLVRFCGYYSQILINNSRILLKTISVTAIRQSMITNRRNKRAALVALDCIQAWAEAFPDDVIYTEDKPQTETNNHQQKNSTNTPKKAENRELVIIENPSENNLLAVMKKSSLTAIRSPFRHNKKGQVPIKAVLTRSTSSTSSSGHPQEVNEVDEALRNDDQNDFFQQMEKDSRKEDQQNPDFSTAPSSSSSSTTKGNNKPVHQTKIYRMKSNFALIYRELKKEKRVKFQRPEFDPIRMPILTMNLVVKQQQLQLQQEEEDQSIIHNHSNSVAGLSMDQSNQSFSFIDSAPESQLPMRGILNMKSAMSLVSPPLKNSGGNNNNTNNNKTPHQSHQELLLLSLMKNEGEETNNKTKTNIIGSAIKQPSLDLLEETTQKNQCMETNLIQKQLEQLESAMNTSVHYQSSQERLLKRHQLEVTASKLQLTPRERDRFLVEQEQQLSLERLNNVREERLQEEEGGGNGCGQGKEGFLLSVSSAASAGCSSASSSSSSRSSSQKTRNSPMNSPLKANNLFENEKDEDEFMIELDDEMICKKHQVSPHLSNQEEESIVVKEHKEKEKTTSPSSTTAVENNSNYSTNSSEQHSSIGAAVVAVPFVSPLSDSLLLEATAAGGANTDKMDDQMFNDLSLLKTTRGRQGEEQEAELNRYECLQEKLHNISAISSLDFDDYLEDCDLNQQQQQRVVMELSRKEEEEKREHEQEEVLLNCSTFSDELSRVVQFNEEQRESLRATTEEEKEVALHRSTSSSLFLDPYQQEEEDNNGLLEIFLTEFAPITTTTKVNSQRLSHHDHEEYLQPNDDPLMIDENDESNCSQNRMTSDDKEFIAALEFIQNNEQQEKNKINKEEDNNSPFTRRKSTKEMIALFNSSTKKNVDNNKTNNKFQKEMFLEAKRSSLSKAVKITEDEICDNEDERITATPRKNSTEDTTKTPFTVGKLFLDHHQHHDDSELDLFNSSVYQLAKEKLRGVDSNYSLNDENNNSTLNNQFLSPQKQSFHEKLLKFQQFSSSQKNLHEITDSMRNGNLTSDQNVEIKFYGSQRVVVRKNSQY